jgi:hypothetical protein
VAAHPNAALTLAVCAALGPFLAKPFNMDDPLFLWTARQIHAHPANPFGFDVNWYGTTAPIWSVTQNPPLASYYLALAADILGWSETALHLAFLLPALAVVLGTHRLARRFCQRPMLAALAVLCAPVFLVSSTTVMCDVLMLAFWVWAVVFWMEGMERPDSWRLPAAGFLIALAALTKYYGICLIPLLAFYSAMSRRGIGKWAASLLIPVLALCAYQWATRALYQHALLWQAASYASQAPRLQSGGKAAEVLTSLVFTGGCLAAVMFLAPWLWRGRVLLALAGGGVLLSLAIFLYGTLWQNYDWLHGAIKLSTEAQMIFWTIGGLSVIALALADLWPARRPNPNLNPNLNLNLPPLAAICHPLNSPAWLLALWVLGTFLFTAFCNWTIAGRSILPMTPAVGILIARRLSSGAVKNPSAPRLHGCGIAWAAAALFAFLVARSDSVLAAAVRQSALQTSQRFAREGQPLWFQGHWGFQYYMAQLGAVAQDPRLSPPRPGEFVVVPFNNTNLYPPDAPAVRFQFGGPRFLTTLQGDIGAGFYVSQAGPLPFALGPVPPETVVVFRMPSPPPPSPR